MLRWVLWAAAAILLALAALVRPAALPTAIRDTIGPFLTLAAIIGCAVLADRLGVFRLLARLLIPSRGPRALTAAAVLAFTGLLSGLTNLDVAVVVGTPVALRAARRDRLPAGRLAVALAVTANATSFLLPTSNVTNLLLLRHAALGGFDYLRATWLAWLLVLAVTVGLLSAWLAGSGAGAASDPAQASAARPSAGAALDLIPLFLTASAIRAVLASGVRLPASFVGQLASGSAISAMVSNLPAAAALRPAGTAGLWAAILACTIGPNLLMTGSIATLIVRRIAREAGTVMPVRRFSAIGSALLPVQLAAATIGLRLAGALH